MRMSRIVAYGRRRFLNSSEHKARVNELRAAFQAKYADKLANAGFVQRILIRLKIRREFRRERRLISPSGQAMYGSR